LALPLSTNSYAQRHEPPSTSSAFGAIGIAAYEDGDYLAAKDWLSAAVYDAGIMDVQGEPDAWATLYLARMHYFGHGVPQNSSLACALFEKAVRTNIRVSDDSNSRAKFKRVLGGDPCPLAGAFSSDEVKALWNGCFWPGLVPATFSIENGSITIEPGHVQVQRGEHRWESPLMGAINACQTVIITPFGHVQVSNRTGTSNRDFVYVFGIESTRALLETPGRCPRSCSREVRAQPT
jgi:hypothetical protein